MLIGDRCFYLSDVLDVPYGQIPVGLANVCFVAGSALQFVDATFVVVSCRITGSGSGLLLNRVSASEGYFDVCLFEKVGDFSDFMAVVCKRPKHVEQYCSYK